MSAGNQFFLALAIHLGSCLVVLAGRRSTDWISALLAAAGSLIGTSACIFTFLAANSTHSFHFPWLVPGGEIVLRVDALSAAFLLIIFIVSGLGNIYGLAYWPRTEHPQTATRLRFFFETMVIGLALVVMAQNTILFLVAWEMMAVSAFFLVATEEQHQETRRAAWIYLVATHIGSACLIAAFVLLHLETGTFLLNGPLPASVSVSVIFLLSLLGFGLKAGLVPLHFWLPGAHANAPSHVSALMSGVMLKAGIYGILRITSLVLTPPMWWALLLAVLGTVTAVMGISLAFAQTDLKRALAYSSVENIGIICIGIALALAGRSAGQPLWIALGLAGAIAHVWNHSLFKSLLFFSSGSVLHATDTRNMDHLGGLLRKMPVTSIAFVVGGLSAAGLPLLNGFVSEWLIALGLFEGIRSGTDAGWYLAFAAPLLAAAGALALGSFVRIIGVSFLGEPRTQAATQAHEAPWLMKGPLIALAAACIAGGILPSVLARPLEAVVSSWGGVVARGQISGFLHSPYPAFAAILILLAASAFAMKWLAGRSVRLAPTWDCGYARPASSMQYTSGSFGEWITSRLLPGVLKPEIDARRAAGFFPKAALFESTAPDPIGERLYEPFVNRWADRFKRLRWVQQGRLSLYLVYILVTTLVAFAWAVVRSYWP